MISAYETVPLGPANRSAIKRFANLCQEVVNSGQPVPGSAFARYVAERITGEDKLDFSFLLSGKKGTGKSWSSLYICWRIAQEIAKIRGGKYEDYFSLKNCALLEDVDGISRLLERTEKYQCVLIDDTSVAVGSRDFATKKSKDFNKIFTTCRTNRWFLILNTPVRTHVDLQLREMVDIVGTVYKPFHKGKFNLLKLSSIELSEYHQNKAYNRRLHFGGQKIDFFAAFSPPREMADEYDVLREQAGRNIIISQNESEKEKKSGETLAEKNLRKRTEEYLPTILKEIEKNPQITVTRLANITGLDRAGLRRICEHSGIILGGFKNANT